MSIPALPTAQGVSDARQLLRDIAVVTPTVRADWLEGPTSRPVFLKLENMQRTGSYKVRGAATMIARLPADVRARGVIAASAGNHAQGVALAARRLGIDCTIVMPRGASWPKVVATRSYGADIILEGTTVDQALEAAKARSRAMGASFVPPFDHADVICGQATVGAEMLEQHPDLDCLVVPVGGGGLVSGIAAAAEHHRAATGKRVRVIGVQAAGAAAFPPSIAAGRPTRLDRIETMADGIAVSTPGLQTLELVSAHVDRVVTVEEASLARAVMLLLEQSKQVAEPAGAAGIAALLEGQLGDLGSVGVIVSGGNIDPLLLQHIMIHELADSDRYLSIIVTVGDQPGHLARMIDIVAGQEANLVEISHQRTSSGLPIGSVAVALSIETRGPTQQFAVVHALELAGYRVRVADPHEGDLAGKAAHAQVTDRP